MAAFAQLVTDPDVPVEALALALAGEFRDVDEQAVTGRLDALAAEVADAAGALSELEALAVVLGERHGFTGARDEYDHPDHSMLDLVLERRHGLPIALSVAYVAVARRAGIALDGVGLPGHYVVGRFPGGDGLPVLLDPYNGGVRIVPFEVARLSGELRPWGAHETVLRMLNNLVGSYLRRNDLSRAIHAAELRLALPLDDEQETFVEADLRSLRARLN